MRNIIVIGIFGLVCGQAGAQVVPYQRPDSSLPRTSRSTTFRQAIERHFESAHPVARSQLRGAVPGSQLIQIHDARKAALARRMQVAGIASPLATSSSANLPGLEMRPALPAGSFPTAVVTGDFNRDGHLDFVVANGKGNDLWIYFGKGDDTFELPRIVPLTKGLSPVFMVAVDLRGSGILDLVVAEFGSSTVGVLIGKGDGTFSVEQEYGLPQPPGALAVADFNHDGKLDIAAAMDTSNDTGTVIPYIATLAGVGDGTLASPVITNNLGFASTAFDLDAADVNGDGLPDLLITGPGLENSTIYLNSGDGTFKEGPLLMGNGDINLVVNGKLADVNGDGCTDAVVADLNGYLWIRLGDCAGNFAAPTWVAMGQANVALRVADVNGDGHLDLIASSEIIQSPNYQFTAGDTVAVALGDGKGAFDLARVYGGSSEAESLAIGDFKGNGRPSIVTGDIDTDTATLYSNDGNGGYGFPQGIYSGQTNQGTYVSSFLVAGYGDGYTFADLNGDGKPDIFQIGASEDVELGNTIYSYYSLAYLNDGSGRFGPSIASVFAPIKTYTQFGDYKLGDFRHTGHLDFVAIGMNTSSTSSQQFILFQPGNGDGTFGKAIVTPVTNAEGSMATGDFNRDGKLDFVTVNGDQSHILTTFLGNGDGTFRAIQSIKFSDPSSVISRLFAGDFNRDGKLDVLIFDFGVVSSAIWEFDGNGDGTFQRGRELFSDFMLMTMGDINNDGHPDIVRLDRVVSADNPALALPMMINYLGQSDGTFLQSSKYGPYNGEWVIAPASQMGDPLSLSVTGDYNGDGKIDEVAFQSVPPPGALPIFAQMLMGNGDGTFTPTYDVFPFMPYVHPNSGHDLDGDGRTDMVSLDLGAGGLMIQRGARAPALQIALADPIVTAGSGCGAVFPNLVSSSDRQVLLSSSAPGVVLPGSVTVPGGATFAKFCFTLDGTSDPHQVFEITATVSGDSATAYGSQAYVAPFAASISPAAPAPVYAGQDLPPITVTIQSQAQHSGGILHFGCAELPSGYSCEFSPAEVNLAAKSSASATLVVHTAKGILPNGPVTVFADDGLAVQRTALTLKIAELSIFGGGTGQPVFAPSPGTTTKQFTVSGIPPYTFSCSGLPAGASCSFSGTQAGYPTVSEITASVTLPAGVTVGTSPFEVNVSSGGVNTSSAQTLTVYTFSLGAPSADQDWAIPGGTVSVGFPVQQANLPSGPISASCSIDSTQVCQLGMGFGPSTTTLMVQIAVPANTPLGQHQLNVTTTFYNNTQQYSFPFNLADFSGSLNSSTATLSSNGSTTVTVKLTATAGFQGQLGVGCVSSPIACNFTQGTVALTGGTAQQVSLVLTAPAAAMKSSSPFQPYRSRGRSSLPAFAIAIPLGLAIGMRRRKVWFSLFTVALLSSAISCGSGSSSAGSGSSRPTQYSVTVEGFGYDVIHRFGTITVTVNR